MTASELRLPAILRRRMAQHPEVPWSTVVRRSIERQLDLLERLDALAETSKFTEADAEEIGHRIKAGMRRRSEQAG